MPVLTRQDESIFITHDAIVKSSVDLEVEKVDKCNYIRRIMSEAF